MISDTERREIAQELRNYAVYGEDETLLGWWARLHFIATGEDDFLDMRSLFDRLADLIDRPTCELVEVWDGEAKQHYLDCTACHFGRLAIELDDAGVRFNSRALWTGVDYTSLTHCPYCGAEVER